MKTPRVVFVYSAVFLSALLLSASASVAESGSFFVKWQASGPTQVKQLFRDGAEPAIILSQFDWQELPIIRNVVWPTTETRPAPAPGAIQGLVFTNGFDPSTQQRQYEEVMTMFRECVRVAAVVAARQEQFDLELFIYMEDTTTGWRGWGNDPGVRNVRLEPGAVLTCTLITNG